MTEGVLLARAAAVRSAAVSFDRTATIRYRSKRMPITRSAKKALRQAKRRTVQNSARRDTYKSAIKRIRKFLAAKQVAEAEKMVPQAYQAVDKAAKANVINKAAAARMKSRLMAAMRKAKAA